MNSSEHEPHSIALAPIFILRLIREPIVSQPVMAPFGVAQILYLFFLDTIGRARGLSGALSARGGDFQKRVHFALILMGG